MKTLSFIIPMYNEEERLQKTLSALKTLSLPRGLTLEEVIFVNDGSLDHTKKLLLKARPSLAAKLKTTVKVISYAQNQGKGYALRQGMKAAHGDYALFFDADMSTPLSELKKFTPKMESGIDVIVGTRKNGKSTVIKHQPKLRETLGKGFTLLTRTALNIREVTDFTCGFKAFSRQSYSRIFAQSIINGWGYDAELLYLAVKQKYTMVEVPVHWSNDERTKVNLSKAIPQTLKEIATIKFHHGVKGFLSSTKNVAFHGRLSRAK